MPTLALLSKKQWYEMAGFICAFINSRLLFGTLLSSWRFFVEYRSCNFSVLSIFSWLFYQTIYTKFKISQSIGKFEAINWTIFKFCLMYCVYIWWWSGREFNSFKFSLLTRRTNEIYIWSYNVAKIVQHFKSSAEKAGLTSNTHQIKLTFAYP